MTTWQEDRLGDFRASYLDWPNLISIGSSGTKECIKTPDVVDKMMQETKYLTDVRTTFDMRTSDFLALGLDLRSQVNCGQYKYEISKLRINGDDPIAQFDCVRVK